MGTENNWLKKELIKIENQRKGLVDRYNTEDNIIDRNDVEHLLNSSLRYTPEPHQNLSQYTKELEMHVKYADDKNTKTHITGVKMWHTHRNPSGCFMCEDIALRHVMLRVIQYLASVSPNQSFKP